MLQFGQFYFFSHCEINFAGGVTKHRTGPRNRPIRYQVDVCYVLKGVLKEQYDKRTVTADRTGVTISIELMPGFHPHVTYVT